MTDLTSPDLGDEEEPTQPSIRLAPYQICSCEEALALRIRLRTILTLTEWDGHAEGARARLEHIARLADMGAPEPEQTTGNWVLQTLEAAEEKAPPR